MVCLYVFASVLGVASPLKMDCDYSSHLLVYSAVHTYMVLFIGAFSKCSNLTPECDAVLYVVHDLIWVLIQWLVY